MSRPTNNRIVHEPPIFSRFKPVGIRGNESKQVLLTLDEYEAFRLADHEGLSHEAAAEEMEISRPTFSRIIENARKKIAMLIIKGNTLSIEGGNINFRNNILRCQDCGHMFKIGFNQMFSECPACQSKNLINLAGGFGHGRCNRNNNLKKGGNYAKRRQNRS